MADDIETGEGDPEEVDPEAAARAQAIVDSMRGKFLDWLKTTEGALVEHLTALEPGVDALGGDASGATDRQAVVEAVTVIAHEMRGLGGTFGYPLVTRVGATLEDYLMERVDATAADVHIIREHIAAVGEMRAAFAVDVDAAAERRLSEIADQLEVLVGA
ncbi:MAG: hypothetical protein HOM25_21940 [Rhodospirillaceae bacterium]|jgi:hypothetical protein|nr:hypothetical protein [Rhodospirillaceae bacterium]MBT5666920.1 hypothetical protein [Rhodospirillaceae bacterium]MBT5812601.1 hypothetical protein [Rhodospirillaceae bacterium]